MLPGEREEKSKPGFSFSFNFRFGCCPGRERGEIKCVVSVSEWPGFSFGMKLVITPPRAVSHPADLPPNGNAKP